MLKCLFYLPLYKNTKKNATLPVFTVQVRVDFFFFKSTSFLCFLKTKPMKKISKVKNIGIGKKWGENFINPLCKNVGIINGPSLTKTMLTGKFDLWRRKKRKQTHKLSNDKSKQLRHQLRHKRRKNRVSHSPKPLALNYGPSVICWRTENKEWL